MLLLVAVTLLIASSIQGVVIDCEFKMVNEVPVGNAYKCRASSELTGNLSIIEEVRGVHLEGRTNKDIEVFEGQYKAEYIPTNLASIFPNLRGIFFNSPLVVLIANDLKPFPNLVRFWSFGSRMTSIEGDLFQHTKKLQWITFYSARLLNIGANILDGLPELTSADFQGNACINFGATTPALIPELKRLLSVQCPPLPSTTVTEINTTPSTTTISNECSIRCSLDDEFDEFKVVINEKLVKNDENNLKQDKTIAEQKKIIDELLRNMSEMREIIEITEIRVVELEKMIREI